MVNELEAGHPPVRVATWEAYRAPRRARLARLMQRLAPVPESIPVGRWLAVRACDRWGLPDAVVPVGQIVTELVGNAVEHAGTPIDLVLTYAPPELHIAVRDRSPRLPRLPRQRNGVPGEEQGRGMLVVATYSAEHGAALDRDGKVVWAALRVNRGSRG
jgi:hypothetical protein